MIKFRPCPAEQEAHTCELLYKSLASIGYTKMHSVGVHLLDGHGRNRSEVSSVIADIYMQEIDPFEIDSVLNELCTKKQAELVNFAKGYIQSQFEEYTGFIVRAEKHSKFVDWPTEKDLVQVKVVEGDSVESTEGRIRWAASLMSSFVKDRYRNRLCYGEKFCTYQGKTVMTHKTLSLKAGEISLNSEVIEKAMSDVMTYMRFVTNNLSISDVCTVSTSYSRSPREPKVEFAYPSHFRLGRL